MHIPQRELALWIWRLLPANPILVRVVQGAGRRSRHLWVRAGYLGVLTFVLVTAVLAYVPGQGSSLADLAKASTQVFKWVAIIQLAMMCFLAPVFTATAITQEKDAQTYNILLTTPLSNAQIVFGSLLSRLYFVIVLLFAGLPVFCVMMLYGGVTLREIFYSFGIAGATATLTGSLAISLAVIKVGTGRTIFSFYLGIALYLLIVYALSRVGWAILPEAPSNLGWGDMSWLTPFHPFLALLVALNIVQAPAMSEVAHYGWPISQLMTEPHYAYIVMTLLLSLVLVTTSMLFVRRGANEGEATLWGRLKARWRPVQTDERRRDPRHVWQNPVAWREALTRASAASRSFLRYFFVTGGVVTGLVLFGSYLVAPGPQANLYRGWLLGIVMIEYATILLVITNVAATSMTRERETNTMDLLLCTPLTSQYIVWGKLRGLVSFAVPFIAVPVATVALFGLTDLVRGAQDPLVEPEAFIELAAVMVVFAGFACMIGLQTSLKSQKSAQAVMTSIGTVALLSFALYGCAFGLGQAGWQFGALVTPLTPFTAISVIVLPDSILDLPNPGQRGFAPGQLRPMVFFGSVFSIAIYALIVAGLYKNMVRNFDMTVRKQHI